MAVVVRAFAALLLVGAALAGAPGGGSPDPFALPPLPASYLAIPQSAPNVDTKGLTLGVQTLNPAVRNLVIIAAGQSNNINTAPTLFTPTHASAIDQFNINDGAIYNAVNPLLGTNNYTGSISHPATWLADALITANKFDRIVIAAVGLSDTAVVDWSTPGGLAYGRVNVVLQRLAARGIVEGSNVTIIVLWGQGESDTGAGTTQSAYTTGLNSTIAQSRAVGFNGKWFIATESYLSGVTSAAVTAGQAATINHGTGVWAGANADALVGSICVGAAACRYDGTHWSNAGANSYATDATNGWQQALAASGAPF